MNKNEERISREVLVEMLGYIIIEIRASDDLRLTRSLADIIHNIPPYMIKNGLTNFDPQNAFEIILKKAEKNKLRSYILQLKETAVKNLSE